MEILKFLAISLLHGIAFATTCKNTTFYATTSPRWINILEEKVADCTYHVEPNTTYSSQYYLSLKWWSVHIKGEMPNCDEEYVELLVTKSKTNVGRFCTNNTEGSPIDLVSYDGSATIKIFSKSNWTYGKIVFYVQMKPYAQSLGGRQDSRCVFNGLAHTGFMHSTGWPLGYMPSQEPCDYYVPNSLVQKEFVFMFMDLDIENRSPNVCDEQDDYIQIKGANVLDKKQAVTISERFCNLSEAKFFRTRFKHIFVDFVRQRGSGQKHRGFVLAYKGYFFKAGTIGPDERRNISTAPPPPTTKPGGNKDNRAGVISHSLSLAITLLFFWQIVIL